MRKVEFQKVLTHTHTHGRTILLFCIDGVADRTPFLCRVLIAWGSKIASRSFLYVHHNIPNEKGETISMRRLFFITKMELQTGTPFDCAESMWNVLQTWEPLYLSHQFSYSISIRACPRFFKIPDFLLGQTDKWTYLSNEWMEKTNKETKALGS